MNLQALIRSLLVMVVVVLLIIIGVYGNRGVPDFEALFSEKLRALRSLEQSFLQLSPLAVAILLVVIVLLFVGVWQMRKKDQKLNQC